MKTETSSVESTHTEQSHTESRPSMTIERREGLLSTLLGVHSNQGTLAKATNVIGRGLLVTATVLGITRLFSSNEEAMEPSAVGAYEPQ